jgi:hypothetical protein
LSQELPAIGHGDRCNHDPRRVGQYEVIGQEGHPYSGRPTSNQLRQIDRAFEDVKKLIGELNAILRKDIPAFLSEVTAQNLWGSSAQPIVP